MPQFLIHNFVKYPENFRNSQEFLADRDNWTWKRAHQGEVIDDFPTVSRADHISLGNIEPVERALTRIQSALDDGEDVADYERAFLRDYQPPDTESEDG